MNRRTLITLGATFAVIAAAFAFLIFNSDARQAMQKTVQESTAQAGGQANPDAAPSSQPGRYIDYSAKALEETTDTRLIFFHAPWCPQCRDLEADIKQQGVPQGVTILKADYDTNQQLRQKYGVTIQTTVVKVDSNGELVKKYVAYDEPKLDAVIENLL